MAWEHFAYNTYEVGTYRDHYPILYEENHVFSFFWHYEFAASAPVKQFEKPFVRQRLGEWSTGAASPTFTHSHEIPLRSIQEASLYILRMSLTIFLFWSEFVDAIYHFYPHRVDYSVEQVDEADEGDISDQSDHNLSNVSDWSYWSTGRYLVEQRRLRHIARCQAPSPSRVLWGAWKQKRKVIWKRLARKVAGNLSHYEHGNVRHNAVLASEDR